MSAGKGFVARRCDPSIDRGKLGGMPSLADLDAFSRWGRAPLFLWYHTCLCHKTVVPQKQAEGKLQLPPRL
jgi:hypothetical protein